MSQPKISAFFKRKEPFDTLKTEEEDKRPVSKKLCPNSEHNHINKYLDIQLYT